MKSSSSFEISISSFAFIISELFSRANPIASSRSRLFGFSWEKMVRLIKNIINPTPKVDASIFKGQKFLAKMNHVLLYVTILSISISGILKKLFNGETLIIFFKKIKLNDNFELAEIFYDVHVFSNYLIITLIALHVLAVIIHKFFFNDNLLKKIT